jgi:SAM-dependent methyltransferase
MASQITHPNPAEIGRIADLLRCPSCTSQLALDEKGFRCKACEASYAMNDGILEFVRFGTAESWGEDAGEDTSQPYQRQYDGEGRADVYNQKYKRQLFKRLSTRRELQLLDQLLSREGRSELLLDLPCGGGRLSHHIAPHTELLLEADASVGQVHWARETATGATPRVWMTASAFHIPFQDASVDGVVCVRLSHHLPSTERERLVRELLRVTRRFAVMTFFDYDSVKNRLRRARARFKPKRPKNTMTVSEVAALARECGAELVAAPRLSYIGSGHRYALMEKRSQ